MRSPVPVLRPLSPQCPHRVWHPTFPEALLPPPGSMLLVPQLACCPLGLACSLPLDTPSLASCAAARLFFTTTVLSPQRPPIVCGGDSFEDLSGNPQGSGKTAGPSCSSALPPQALPALLCLEAPSPSSPSSAEVRSHLLLSPRAQFFSFPHAAPLW